MTPPFGQNLRRFAYDRSFDFLNLLSAERTIIETLCAHLTQVKNISKHETNPVQDKTSFVRDARKELEKSDQEETLRIVQCCGGW